MSNLTEKILCSIDYESIKQQRRSNYMQLDEQLSAKNGIHLTMEDASVPMVYPYLTSDVTLRDKLINNKVFVATYWPNIGDAESYEAYLKYHLLPLPIDQRYNEEDMKRIIEMILDEVIL